MCCALLLRIARNYIICCWIAAAFIFVFISLATVLRNRVNRLRYMYRLRDSSHSTHTIVNQRIFLDW